ncbi:tubulin epsilon chain [Cyclospora cayetanensis]|uniref:Tubulin epsilon chain n=1 Tax=Cyclospora cayetanensis TaxID=88456 RepID=A0A6P6RRP2_9EIME|nr:tubulin epsilon chain [Cyclospora cayetanensis]
MPREVLTFQVGQCGNQIGSRLWQVLLEEHGTWPPKTTLALPFGMRSGAGTDHIALDEGMSSIFKICSTRQDEGQLQQLKARAFLVDMEEGVIHGLLRGPFSSLFDEALVITDVSGSGNNCPGNTDDVITSPYNTALALRELRQHATCVLPVCNDSLSQVKGAHSVDSAMPFAHANGAAAQMIAHLTSSVRFSGPLDIDVLDLNSNLVPYRGLQFLFSAFSPLFTEKAVFDAAAESLKSLIEDYEYLNTHLAPPPAYTQAYAESGLSYSASKCVCRTPLI